MKMDKKSEAPLWIFWLLGGCSIAIAIMSSALPGKLWSLISDITLNIGMAIIAVSMIDWIWRRVGGDPLTTAIFELRTTTALLADLTSSGIKRLFINRGSASERKNYIMKKISQAKEVDMLGIALRSGWSSAPEFQELLKNQARKDKTSFRIIVFDPMSKIVIQRAAEEDGKPSMRIAESAASTLRVLEEIKNSLPKRDRDSIKIKVVKDTSIYCSIIRVDETILVTKYLLHLSGTNSETIEIEGKDTNYYKFYMDEFNAMWNRSAEWPTNGNS